MNIPAKYKLTYLLFLFSLHLTLIAQSPSNSQFFLLAGKTISRHRVVLSKIRNPFSWQQYCSFCHLKIPEFVGTETFLALYFLSIKIISDFNFLKDIL